MSNLQVFFEVPPVIDDGLRTGILERVGGVVRDASTKHVVMWLRDSGIVEETSSTLQGGATATLLNPINAVLSMSQTITAMDGHLKRQVVNTAGQQVTQVGQQVSSLASQMLMGNVVSLAFAAMTLYHIDKRLDKVSKQIDNLITQVNAQFERDRRSEFHAALKSAKDLLNAEKPEMRPNLLQTAVEGLTRASKNFIEDFETAIERAQANDRHVELAQHFLLQACYATSAIAQCYAQVEETRAAAERLNDELKELRPAFKRLIKAWMTSTPGFYLHPSLDRDTMERAISLRAWLRGERINIRESKAYVITEIVDELRRDLWNNWAKFESRNPIIEFVSERRGAGKTQVNLIQRYQRGLQQSIQLVETIERLVGYELELRSIRLSVSEWSDLVDESQLKQYGGALIVDEEALQQVEQRLNSQPVR